MFENPSQDYGISVQNKGFDNTGYFANQQQDYLSLDESDDFYDNEEKAGVGNGRDAETSDQSQISAPQVRSTQQPIAVHNVAHTPTLETHEQAAEEGLNVDKTIQKPSERLAQLRATLLSQQRKSATPTPSKAVNNTKKPGDTVADGRPRQIVGNGTVNTRAEAGSETKASKATVKQRVDDKSLNTSENPTPNSSTSNADVEALIHSVKASIPPPASSKPKVVENQVAHPTSIVANRKADSKTHGEYTVPDSQLRKDSIDDGLPSEASELGEIREDTPKPGPVRQPPEPQSPKVRADTVSSTDRKADSNSNTYELAKDVENVPKTQSGKATVPIRDSNKYNSGGPSTTDGTKSRRESSSTAPKHNGDRAWPEQSHRSHDAIRDSRTQPVQEPRLRLNKDLDPGQRRSQDNANISQHGTNDHDRRSAAKNQHSSLPTGNHNVKAVAEGAQMTEPTSITYYEKVSPKGGERTTNDLERSLATIDKPSLVKPDLPGAQSVRDLNMVDVTGNDQGASNAREREPSNRIDPSSFANQQVYEDVVDWLELTGWGDQVYRNQGLARHRKMKALDAQRAELEREAQLEMEQRSRSLRARSALPVESSVPQSVFSTNVLRTTSSPAMGPPPLPMKEGDEIGIQIKNSANNDGQATTGSMETDQSSKQLIKPQAAPNATNKRPRADSFDMRKEMSSDKVPRLDMADRSHGKTTLTSPMIKDESLESRITRSHEPFSATNRRSSTSPSRRYRTPSPVTRRASDKGGYDSRSWFGETSRGTRYSPAVSRNPSPSRRDSDHKYQHRDHYRINSDFQPRDEFERDHEYQSYVPNGYRGRGNRRGYGYNSYRNRSYNIRGGAQGRSSGSESLNLKDGDARYFMIKSWNAENVEIAKRDGTWATQQKNLETLTEAYNTRRHVILFFSVNNSRAFQGYARMASAPGAAPTPSWAKQLIWESTPPFYIEWISTNETRFNRCGQLKNAFNEGQAVLVGRDGQEIEQKCGRGLCELIDNCGSYRNGTDNEWMRAGSADV